MCGIAGIVHRDHEGRVSRRELQAMCDQMHHRGPDDSGLYIQGPVGLGSRRLSIIGVESGRQPVTNEDGTVWVVFNGEIYNFRSLRCQLEKKGHRFRTESDTEVIVHLYEDLGEKCVHQLHGMFAFAIWDVRRKLLFMARDRLGIKPLYYLEGPHGLLFGSELKVIRSHPWTRLDLDVESVAEYFTHLCVPGERSIYESVHKLPPAHTLTYHLGKSKIERYWRLKLVPDQRVGEGEWVEALRNGLRKAVECHMVSDVPVGALLSGGLDSGAMVAIMSEMSSVPIRTFTVGFAEKAGRYDERKAARKIAKRCGSLHKEFELETKVDEILPGVVRSFDEPFADSSAIPNWLVCRQASRDVKVVLSGLGADELFGGYERYVGLLLGGGYDTVPAPARKAIRGIVGNLPYGRHCSTYVDRMRRFCAVEGLPAPEKYRRFIAAFPNIEDILHPDVCSSLRGTTTRYATIVHESAAFDSVDLALDVDFNLYLPDDLLTLADRIGMAHSLEIRVPFLDQDLIELAAGVPRHLKVQGFRKKILFRKAISEWLPAEHLSRSKQGFSIPIGNWLRGSLKPMLLDAIHGGWFRSQGLLNTERVNHLLVEHLSGKCDHEVRLWAVLCFLEWQRQAEQEAG